MEDDRLRGWKEIAKFLHASERSAQRWERHLRLPVHRVDTARSAIIFASREELIAWLQSADGQAAGHEPEPYSDGSDAANAPQHPPATVSNPAERLGALNEAARRRPTDGEVDAPLPRGLHGRHLVLAALFVAVICVPFVIRSAMSSGGPAAGSRDTDPPQSPSRATPGTVGGGDVLVLRVQIGDGDEVKMGVRVGTVATCAFANHRPFALSAEPTPRGVILHVYDVQPAPGNPGGQLAEIGAIDLSQGATRTMARGAESVRVEWIKTLQAPPAK